MLEKISSPDLNEFLEEAGLQLEVLDKRVSAFSKEMQQKMGIATALAKNAKVLLLNEPSSRLDPKASNEFEHLLEAQNKRSYHFNGYPYQHYERWSAKTRIRCRFRPFVRIIYRDCEIR